MSITIDLTDTVAVVTGSTRGIGRAIATTLYEAGAKVAIVGRDATKANEVAAALGDRAFGIAFDVADPAQVEVAFTAIEQALGGVTALINNAGVTRDNVVLRLTADDWDAVLDANLKGAFLCTKAVLRGMMKRRGGRIINVSSVVGLTGNKGQANYAASKAGLIGFTKSVAKEYASRGILVNCLAPGFIDTDMTSGLPEEARAALLGEIALGRLGTPNDIASAVLFLVSNFASYITGQTLVVDGGMVM